jgi:hypothetical protein
LALGHAVFHLPYALKRLRRKDWIAISIGLLLLIWICIGTYLALQSPLLAALATVVFAIWIFRQPSFRYVRHLLKRRSGDADPWTGYFDN